MQLFPLRSIERNCRCAVTPSQAGLQAPNPLDSRQALRHISCVMDGLRFIKMHGLGNDFVVIDGRELAVALGADEVRGPADRLTERDSEIPDSLARHE